jgi:transcriptional regulator of met regulon
VDPPVIAAIVAATASLLVAVVNVVAGERRERRIRTLEERAKKEERELEAEKVLDRYRGPLVSAAFDLQERLDNIIDPKRSFLRAYGTRRSARREEAVRSTLFRVAQYFGWTEILRRDIQLLNFREPDQRRAVTELFADVGRTFADDRLGTRFMLWFEEQRAIGERMIDDEREVATCVGYATFNQQYEQDFARWLDGFAKDLTHEQASTSRRLIELRSKLRLLVEYLDPDEERYEQRWRRSQASSEPASATPTRG